MVIRGVGKVLLDFFLMLNVTMVPLCVDAFVCSIRKHSLLSEFSAPIIHVDHHAVSFWMS